MDKDRDKNNSPELRFPGFSDGWQAERLGEIARLSKGAGISKEDIVEDGKTKAIRYGELYTKYSEVINEVDSSTNADRENLVFSKRNDILLPSSGESSFDIATASCVLHDNIALSGDINIIRSTDNGVFLAYYLNSARKTDIAKLAQGVSVVHLYNSDLKDLVVKLPDTSEQQKIASFLTAVDQRITKQQQKLSLLKDYKKGVMQKLFTQQIRFKDESGEEYPEWEERRLGDVLYERKEYAPKDGTYEHISLTTSGVVPKSERYERDFLVGSEDKKYRITRLDDICYNPANLKFGVIARNKYKEGIFSPIYVTFEARSADTSFIEHMVTRNDFIQRARKYEQGTVYERMAVNPEDLLKLNVDLPVTAEQQKIADLLTSIDERIKTEENLLTSVKTWKVGLLQKMFI